MRGIFHSLEEGEIRSETWRFGGEVIAGYGEGLKFAKDGTQGESQMFIELLEEIDQHAPFVTTFLHLRIQLQSQEDVVGMGEDKKLVLWRYLADRDFTQRRS